MKKVFVQGLAISVFMGAALPALAEFTAPAKMGTTAKGEAWVDAKGMTLYTFEKDADGKSMCNGECATEWPPLPVAEGAVADGDWTIVTRDDGSMMWAYEGHPLYTFVDDKKAGEVTGDGMDGFHLAK